MDTELVIRIPKGKNRLEVMREIIKNKRYGHPHEELKYKRRKKYKEEWEKDASTDD